MDIEDVTNFSDQNDIFKNIDLKKLEGFLQYIIDQNPNDFDQFDESFKLAKRKFRICPKKSILLHYFRRLVINNTFTPNDKLEKLMTKKFVRQASGVEIITVFTSPYPTFTGKDGIIKTQKFSCGKNCAYCPLEGQIKLNCIVTNIKQNDNSYDNSYDIYLKSTDPVDEVRVITYITKSDGSKLYCRNFFNFDDDSRTFVVNMIKKFGKELHIDEIVTCTKIEQTRSYISTEPGVRRANQSNFNATLQFFDRGSSLECCGHIIDKVEVLVLGGTWSHYPREYQDEFIRDIYYAANIFFTRKERQRMTLEEEININQTTKCRIIGLTLETRPDCINKYEIERFRKFNCTRIQIGVQHTDDEILEKIERGCYNRDTIKALKLLIKNCYKVDYHLMPDLPGSNYEKDKEMFDNILGIDNITRTTNYCFAYNNKNTVIFIFFTILLICCSIYFGHIPFLLPSIILLWYLNFNNKDFVTYKLTHPELQADQWKIYPTEVTRWTKIYDLYHSGEFKPYAEEMGDNNRIKMINLILEIKKNIFPWIRLNRVIRDIPESEIIAGNKCTNLRQKLQKIIKDENSYCKCIRCREVRNRPVDFNIKQMVRKYNGIEGDEYFISIESKDEKIIYGFCRFRINHNNNDVMPILHDCGLVRELHVYGAMKPHYSKNKCGKDSTQHHGFGKILLKKAEQIAYFNGIKKMAIISGVGVREYYIKRGYYLNENFMFKNLSFYGIKLTI